MIQPLAETKMSFGLLPGNDVADNRVYYIENGKSKKLTKYVLDHYDELMIKFRQHGLVFIFVDELMLAQTSPKQLENTIRKFLPDVDIHGKEFKNLFEACSIEVAQLQGLAGHLSEMPSFISNQTDRAYQVELDSEDFFREIFNQLAEAYGRENEVELSDVQRVLLYTIKDPIPSIIKQPENDYESKLILEDFGKELHFEPQAMALYELLLSEPDGIRTDELPNKRERLQKLYMSVSSTDGDINTTIDNIINSPSTLISRIKKEVRKVLIGPRLYRFYEVHKYRLHDNNDLLIIELPLEFRKDFLRLR